MAVARRRRWCAAMLAVMLVLVAVPVGAQSELDTARANARAAAEAADEARARAQQARQRADDAIDQQQEHIIDFYGDLASAMRFRELFQEDPGGPTLEKMYDRYKEQDCRTPMLDRVWLSPEMPECAG